MNTLLTFNEVIEQTAESNKRVLLCGNGFSMAYDYNRFSFTSLLQSAVDSNIISKDEAIYKLFKKFSTTDFEKIIKLLDDSSVVIDEYKNDESAIESDIINNLQNDSCSLKEHLVAVITNNHPEKATKINDEEYNSCINFIKYFNTIYTLNYDLLLYWASVKYNEVKQGLLDCRLDVSDGFKRDKSDELIFQGGTSSINYLHGALHIYDESFQIVKNEYSTLEGCLKEQTLEKLNKNQYPIFISEGTWQQKKSKIIHNAYLNHCFKSFKAILNKNNSLIIFGTSLKSNDEHIKELIMNSNIKEIFIGISNESAILDFQDLIDTHGNKVQFYDYRSVNVWRHLDKKVA